MRPSVDHLSTVDFSCKSLTDHVNSLYFRSMFTLSHRIAIHAEPDRVWQVLTEFSAYPDWNPYLKRVTGELGIKRKLKIEMQLQTGHPYLAKPRVLEIENESKLTFRSRLYFPGFYDVTHFFVVLPTTKHRTELTYTQEWKGKVAQGLYKKMGKETEDAILAMLKALKKRVQQME